MNLREIAIAALLSAIAALAPPAVAQAGIPASVGSLPLPSLAPMIRRVSPAVVNISSRGVMPATDASDVAGGDSPDDTLLGAPDSTASGQPEEVSFTKDGSGVIVDARRGYILTNAHVVAHAATIEVTLQDGRAFRGKLVGADTPSDIAVVQIDAHGLSQIRLGDSAHLAVGDFVVAIGDPFGLPHSATAGIVSGLDRSGLGLDDDEDYIQTDASINPGNSGGALVDLRGDLVGINTAILSGSGDSIGIGFAIPVNAAERVMRQLIRYGAVQRGELGLSVLPVTPEVAHVLGVRKAEGGIVVQVTPGSPAAAVGIRAGDVVTAVAGHAIHTNSDLRRAIGLSRVGHRVAVDLLHDGLAERRRVVLADTADPGPAQRVPQPENTTPSTRQLMATIRPSAD